MKHTQTSLLKGTGSRDQAKQMEMKQLTETKEHTSIRQPTNKIFSLLNKQQPIQLGIER